MPTAGRSTSDQRSPRALSLRTNLPVPIIVALMVPLMYGLAQLVARETFNFYDLYTHRVIMLCGIAAVMAVSLQLINGFAGLFSLGHAGFMAVGAYASAYPSLHFSRGMTDPAAVLQYFIALLVSVGLAALLLIALLWGIRKTGRLHKSLPPWLGGALFLLVLIDIVGAGLLLPQISAGVQGLYSVVAPSEETALLQLPQWLGVPLCMIVLLLGGGTCAAATGLVVGLPTLRLSGDYLAIATLGFAEIIRVAITNSHALGGATGLAGMPTPVNFAWLYGTLIVVIVLVWRLAYSAKGRAIQAVREDEIAARAIGIDTTHHKVMAFIAGSFFAGVGGVLYAHFDGYITPNDFNFLRSIEFVVMVTLGGLGSISGAILAAFALTYLPELLRDPPSINPFVTAMTGTDRFSWPLVAILGAIIIASVVYIIIQQRPWRRLLIGFLIGLVTWELLILADGNLQMGERTFRLTDARMVLYALLLILMMLLRPRGLLGGVELWPRRRPRVTPPAKAVHA